ncbi:MAG: acyltransferase [Lautropia sp.]|nr:acyltransferase [Lautropia sp.]
MSAMSASATRLTAAPQPQDKTIYSIQALRFIAAALVVVSHIRTEYGMAPFGSAGVDIFFVISGFIIHYVTRNGAPQFFTRRLIRIVPLYWLGTLALGAAALFVPSLLNQVSFSAEVLLKSLFFLPVWNEQVQYHLPLLTLGWSLNYEILFYLIYFIALKISHQHRLLLSSVMLVALTQLHGFVAPESMLAFWSDAYIIEFIYGMLLANLVSHPQAIDNARLPISAALLALAAYCYLLLPSSGLVTPAMALDKWVRVLVIGLPSAALVMLTLAAEQSVRRLPQVLRHGINFLGELSYPIYIFHIYVMGVLKRLGALNLGMPAYIAAVAGATLLASALVYLLYEQPARKLLSRLLLRGKGEGKRPTSPGALPPGAPLTSGA